MMPEVRSPRYLPQPVRVWVKCEEARSFSPAETACLIRDAEDELQLIFVHPDYCRQSERLVSGMKIAIAPDDTGNWLIDFPSTDRLVMSQDLVELAHGSPV